MNLPCTSETSAPSYRELRDVRSTEIDDVAEALAEEYGSHWWLLTHDEEAHVRALATRAVAVLMEPHAELEKELAAAEVELAKCQTELEASEEDGVRLQGRIDEVEEALQALLGAAGLPPAAKGAIEMMIEDLKRTP